MNHVAIYIHIIYYVCIHKLTLFYKLQYVATYVPVAMFQENCEVIKLSIYPENCLAIFIKSLTSY